MKMINSVITVLAASALFFGLAGCQKSEGPAAKSPVAEGPAERAGKEIDKTVDKAGQQVEKTGEKIQDMAKDAKK